MKRGFTLVEVLAVVFILSSVFAAILWVLNVANISWDLDSGLLDLQQGVRQAMDGMVWELRQAEPGSVTRTEARVDFSIPGISNISYYLLNSQIVREHPADTLKILANNISALNFCCLGGTGCVDCSTGNLRIDIQAGKTVRNRVLSFGLTERVKVRNEN